MNSLLIIGKYLDQPRLVRNFAKTVPALLVAGGALYAADHVNKTPQKDKNKEFIKSVAVLTGTIGSALLATRGMKAIKINGRTIFKGFHGLSEHIHSHGHAHEHSHEIDNFLKTNQISTKTREILQKSKTKVLSLSEVRTLFEELYENPQGKEILDELIPNPENIDSKHIFGEIKRLSVMGLVPVLGGIAGGIVGDNLTEKDWKSKIPNKIKEGSYQYLSNIFLCNVGAGAALWAMEKAKKTSKAARAIGMLAGILIVGVLGGSAVANWVGRTCIDPLLGHKHKKGSLYSERTPEILDISLHIDDVSIVAVLSGLKWIEPALPILYSISGYRAGIGYRNNQ